MQGPSRWQNVALLVQALPLELHSELSLRIQRLRRACMACRADILIKRRPLL